MGLIDFGVANLNGVKGLASQKGPGYGQNEVKGHSLQKGPMGVCRMGLRDLSRQEGPGCGLSLEAEWG